MANLKAFLVLGLLAALPAVADVAGVSDVVVHSRWPWEAKVDISCALGTAAKDYDFDVTATWDGQTTPVFIDTFVGPGAHATTWDPADAGRTSAPVTNFRVAFTRVPVSERTYMFVDLVDKTVTYSSTYTQDSGSHRRRVIPFRRVRAGVYTNGYENALQQIPLDYGSKGLTTLASRGRTPLRQVTFLSDYYISIYKVTKAQWKNLGVGTEDNYNVIRDVYCNLRGSFDVGINWPTSGFAVTPDSKIGRCRAFLKGVIPSSFVLDLPTGTQWEVAMRAGEDGSHFWSLPQSLLNEGLNPGNASATLTDMTNTLNRIAIWSGNQAAHEADGTRWNPGEMIPNAWNIYDPVGVGTYEWVLDTNFKGDAGVDPVGRPADTRSANRKLVSNGYSSLLLECVPGEYFGGMPEAGNASGVTYGGFRLVLNTRNWMEGR